MPSSKGATKTVMPQKYVSSKSSETRCAPRMPTMHVTARLTPTMLRPIQLIHVEKKLGSYSRAARYAEKPERHSEHTAMIRLMENNTLRLSRKSLYFLNTSSDSSQSRRPSKNETVRP